MASRFVSGGVIDAASGESVEKSSTAKETPKGRNQEKWEAVQREIEEERKKRAEARVREVEGGEKSLFEILEANKAAKQAAFEEQTRIKNQFRALDDDEVQFLEDVRESKRAEEERVRRETEEGLKAFHRAQKTGSGAAGASSMDDVTGFADWEVGRKRKRAKEKEGIKGVRRKVDGGKRDGNDEKKVEEKVEVKKEISPIDTKSSPVVTKPKMGLVDYGSDSDE